LRGRGEKSLCIGSVGFPENRGSLELKKLQGAVYVKKGRTGGKFFLFTEALTQNGKIGNVSKKGGLMTKGRSGH